MICEHSLIHSFIQFGSEISKKLLAQFSFKPNVYTIEYIQFIGYVYMYH